jgi:hypothetical protein
VGDATVTDPSGKTIPINAGLTLFAGQVLNVGDEESRVEVHFTDGTQVDLGSGTSIRFLAEASEGKKFHLERGAIQVQTVPERENQPVVVTTNQARITAGNSRFRLYQEGTASRVELAQGTAHLESQKGGQSLDLDEGLFVVITDEPQPMETQSFPMGNCRLLHTFLKAGDAVCFSPDGKRVVASHFARGWKVWDSEDGALLVSAPGNGERTDALSFTAINDTVIALSGSGTADLWTIGEPRAIRTRLRDQGLRSNVVSQDGRWLAQGGSKGEVVVWEVNPQSGGISLRRSFAIKPSRLALSGAGSHLAVSLWGGEIIVFEVKTGREVTRYKLRSTPTPLALSTDARFVAAYANKEGLILFDRQTDSRQTLWAGEGARVSHLLFSADGRILFAGLQDGTVRAWSTATGELLLVLETGHRHVSRIATTADLSLLATLGDNDCVKIWECELP